MVEDGTTYEELRGVELSGWGEVIDDRDELFKVGVSVFERYYGPYDDMAPFVDECSTSGWPSASTPTGSCPGTTAS